MRIPNGMIKIETAKLSAFNSRRKKTKLERKLMIKFSFIYITRKRENNSEKQHIQDEMIELVKVAEMPHPERLRDEM